MRYAHTILVLVATAVCSVSFTHAAGTSGLVNGIWFSDDPITDFAPVTVHSIVRNHTDVKLQGIATLIVDGNPVGAKEVQVNVDGIAHIRIEHRFDAGAHSVAMSFTAGNGSEVTLSELSAEDIFVVQDTDGDGIRNTTDPDDDNDSIPDEEDPNPLVKDVIPVASVSLSEQGKTLLSKLTKRNESTATEDVEEAPETVAGAHATSTEPHALIEAFQSLEETRKRTAAMLRAYEEEQRLALEEIARAEEALASVEGFEPSHADESKKREHQIAAAGASVTGTVLEHGWMFYLHVFILVASVLHVTWGWFRKRFATIGVADDDE